MLLVNITNKFILFAIVFMTVLTIVVIYNLASTFYLSVGTVYNFDPLPTVHPSDLPDSSMRSQDIPVCLMAPTKCTSSGECSECADNGNITCSDPKSDVVYELPSGISIPSDGNSYCIPKAATNMPCNRYTGKYVWTDSAESGQEWKCECLYPDLFNNPQSGCTDQVACNSSNRQLNASHPAPIYKLADVTSLRKGNDAKFWDPTDPNADLTENPYTVTDTKDAKYVCACGITTDDDNKYKVDSQTVPPYVRLPNDPYNCHVDTCDELQGYLSPVMLDQATKLPGCTNEICSCAMSTETEDAFWCNNNANTFRIGLGKYKNKCYSTSAG